jgi:hypothetical protein
MDTQDKLHRLHKLRLSSPVQIKGNEITASDDLKVYKKNALAYGKKLRGTYINKDTGAIVHLVRSSIQEVLQHDYKNIEQLQSVAAIPDIIENAIYMDAVPNEDIQKNPAIKEFHYYLCGLNIGGENFTVRTSIAVYDTEKLYYDHKLTRMNVTNLPHPTTRITNPEPSTADRQLTDCKDIRLFNILQIIQ